MLTYCVKCRTKTKNLNSKILKCTECGLKKSRFVKEQEAKGLFSSLGIKTPLSKIPLLGNILFCVYKNE